MNKIRADIALISVTNTEYAAVTQAHNWRTFTIVGDDQLYAVAEFERDGKKYTLVHVNIPIIIKSVCDYATSEKSDDYHRFAAFTCCQFAKLLYEKYLPLD